MGEKRIGRERIGGDMISQFNLVWKVGAVVTSSLVEMQLRSVD